MKYILIWSWISLASGQGFSVTMNFDSAEKCLAKKQEVLQKTEFENSKAQCFPTKLGEKSDG